MNETELLFTELLNCSREKLYLDKDCRLKPNQARFLANALSRRIKGEPIQYILGKVDFMGLEFRLTSDVLIPRPETEMLVETAMRISCQLSQPKADPPAAGVVSSQIKILDIGTGSGCIAVSLAKFLPQAKIVATDISEKALEIARQNAETNRVSNKITFLKSNLFASLPIRDKRYEICVCNPPYIPRAEIDGLEPELSYEPRIALDGGRDGLYFYRRIIRQASEYLKTGGFLILEMGFKQCPEIKKILASQSKLKTAEVIKDYNDIDRVMVLRNG